MLSLNLPACYHISFLYIMSFDIISNNNPSKNSNYTPLKFKQIYRITTFLIIRFFLMIRIEFG